MEGQIAFKRQRVTFPEVEDEPQFKEVWFHFPATVWTADCAINGFKSASQDLTVSCTG